MTKQTSTVQKQNPESPTEAQPASQQKVQSQPNEGEGNRTAARRYDEATAQYIHSGRVDEAAKKAKDAIEGPEAEELRKAEEKGKRGV